MNSKAIKRQLLAAIAMVLVAALALGSSTYAWFAVNTNVTAEGMSVIAKTNGAFVQIKPKDGSIDGTGLRASATTASATIYPAKENFTAATEGWQYAFSDQFDVAVSNSVLQDVPDGEENKYRLLNEFTIFTKENANNTTTEVTDLKVDSYKITGTSAFIDAVGLVIVCGDNVQKIPAADITSGNTNTVTSAVTLANKVDNTGVDVKIYIYIDGEQDVITSQNATTANLTGLAAEVVFTSTAPSNT